MTEIKELNCRDVGVDCDFCARAASVEEVVEQCAEHARTNHGMKSFTPELYAKMRAHIKTVPGSNIAE